MFTRQEEEKFNAAMKKAAEEKANALSELEAKKDAERANAIAEVKKREQEIAANQLEVLKVGHCLSYLIPVHEKLPHATYLPDIANKLIPLCSL